MGLIGDLIVLAHTKKEIRKLDESVQKCVENGLLTEEQAEEIFAEGRAAGERAYAETKEKQWRESHRQCCANCKYFHINDDYYLPHKCFEHDRYFTREDIRDNVHRRKSCDSFWQV